MNVVSGMVLVLYLVATVGLLIYGLNCYVMLSLFAFRRKQATRARTDMFLRNGDILGNPSLPVVTTQIAVFNEFNVVERVVRAACAMDYPRDKHEIQILDDSTDETTRFSEGLAEELRAQGHDIKVLHRVSRLGFKAGALQEGLEKARGDFIAVFDADFVPPRDYLTSIVPFFMENKTLGFAQARWGHLNPRRSLLTRAQSVGIDGHFVIEQVARCWNNLFMNFNGTAGMWRRSAIDSAGGWQWDTLTEDLDLSYRVQFAGWTTLYLPDLVVPAELPEDVNAFRGQQFRWAKGSFQTLIKLAPTLMRMRVSWFKKFQALLHMSGYLVHPLMLTLALLSVPILTVMPEMPNNPLIYALISIPMCLSIIAPSTMYIVSQGVTYRRWLSRILLMPALIVIGVGLAVSNTQAILEAIFGKESGFIRTPKRGDKQMKRYKVKLSPLALLEIALGLYAVYALQTYILAGRFMVTPFLALYAAGFLFIGLLTVVHSLGFEER